MGNSKTKPTVQEIVREQKLAITRQCRQLDRERQKLEREEEKMKKEIQMLAKKNQVPAMKTVAKSVVRTRAQINKFYEVRGQLQSISNQLSQHKSMETMNQALKSASSAIMALDKQVNLTELRETAKQFVTTNEKMEMKQEMMEEAMDMALEVDNEGPETEKMVNQLLDEIGVSVTAGVRFYIQMANAPTAIKQNNVEEQKVDIGQLEARLAGIKQ